jgi:hypothetical protein
MATERTKYIFAGGDDLNSSGRERSAGLFRHTQSGGEWEPLTRGLPSNVEARAFALHPGTTIVNPREEAE